MTESAPERALNLGRALAGLGRAYRRGGCARFPETARREATGYKKGCEIRFTAADWDEVERIRELLVEAGLKPAQPYSKHSRIIQPVYGKAAVEAILKAAGKRRPSQRSRKRWIEIEAGADPERVKVWAMNHFLNHVIGGEMTNQKLRVRGARRDAARG